MILEAFSKYLHEADPAVPSMEVLARWLWEKLSMPPLTNVDQVIHCEVSICRQDSTVENVDLCEILMPQSEIDSSCDLDIAYVFRGTSKSGDRLLSSLKSYGMSYEQQKWARWVHHIKASDFSAIDARLPDESD